MFEVLEIKQLRTSIFSHVDPGERGGHLGFAVEKEREVELRERVNCVGRERNKYRKKKDRGSAR
jgi:hypothetical protein